MYHPPCGQIAIAVVHPASPVASPFGESLNAVAQDSRTACAMDRAVNSTATTHRVIGGVDYRINVLLSDVPLNCSNNGHRVSIHRLTLGRPCHLELRSQTQRAQRSVTEPGFPSSPPFIAVSRCPEVLVPIALQALPQLDGRHSASTASPDRQEVVHWCGWLGKLVV